MQTYVFTWLKIVGNSSGKTKGEILQIRLQLNISSGGENENYRKGIDKLRMNKSGQGWRKLKSYKWLLKTTKHLFGKEE